MRWLSAAVMLTLYTSSSWAFSIDDVAKQAQSLAGKGYETPKSNLPSVFRDMKYADYQQIQFNHDKAYWNNLKTPFKLEFYHQGMYGTGAHLELYAFQRTHAGEILDDIGHLQDILLTHCFSPQYLCVFLGRGHMEMSPSQHSVSEFSRNLLRCLQ